MRNIKTHNKTIKKKLNKCAGIFAAYSALQLRYAELLDNRDDILEIKCNVRINCELGDNYTTDFYCILKSGEVMVRECVYQERLFKPLTIKMLDASKNYWESKGITNWGIVLDEKTISEP